MKEANEFVDLIREIVQEELEHRDSTTPVAVESVNPDGTLNVYILPDRSTVVSNIINATKYEFSSGDTALVYKVRNQLGNSFVIAKYNP